MAKWLKFFLHSYKLFQISSSIRVNSFSRPLVTILITEFFVILVDYRPLYRYKKHLFGQNGFLVDIYAVTMQTLPEYGCPLIFRFHVWTLRRGDPLVYI